jgi:hypothetical protein
LQPATLSWRSDRTILAASQPETQNRQQIREFAAVAELEIRGISSGERRDSAIQELVVTITMWSLAVSWIRETDMGKKMQRSLKVTN